MTSLIHDQQYIYSAYVPFSDGPSAASFCPFSICSSRFSTESVLEKHPGVPSSAYNWVSSGVSTPEFGVWFSGFLRSVTEPAFDIPQGVSNGVPRHRLYVSFYCDMNWVEGQTFFGK